MAAPQRFSSGVTNVASSHPLGQFLAPAPTKMHVYWNDFDTYTAAEWTVTETNASATEALTDGDGGLILLTNTATEDDILSMQKVGESFLPAAGKKMWFGVRFQCSDVTENDIVFGLVKTDTSPLSHTDGIVFVCHDGDDYVDFVCTRNSTSNTTTALATLVDATWIELEWYFDGVDKFYYYVNGALTGDMTYTTTTFPSDEVLTVTMHLEAGAAGAKTMTIDWIYAAKER